MHEGDIAGWFAVMLSTASAAYLLLAIIAIIVKRPRDRLAEESGDLPPITVLKPLCGDEPCLYEALRSFCRQDYPQFQIVFGVREASDAACATVASLVKEFPDLDLKLVVDERINGQNLKVSNLSNMLGWARHDCLVISDSDVFVEHDYLRKIAVLLKRPKVGLVTCMYRARTLAQSASRFGALFIDDWFMPAVMVSRLLGVQSFVSGVTMAIHRDTLSQIGGLESVTDCLADDYMLGCAVRRLGLRTVVAPFFVETMVAEDTLHAVVRHELRWMSTIRSVQPIGYFFSGITCGVTLPLLGVILTGGSLSLLYLLGGALLLRLVLHRLASRRAPVEVIRSIWLLPVRDLFVFGAWMAGFVYRSVTWREKAVAVSNI